MAVVPITIVPTGPRERKGTTTYPTGVLLSPAEPQFRGIGRSESIALFPTTLTGRAITNVGLDADVTTPYRVTGHTINGQHPTTARATEPTDPIMATGVELVGLRSRIELNEIKNFHSTGLVLRAQQFSIGNIFFDNWVNIHVTGADAMVQGCYVAEARDYCLRAGGSNFVSVGNHYYGAELAAVRVESSVQTFTGDILNDARWGLHTWFSSMTTLNGCLIAQNYRKAALLEGFGCELNGCLIRVNIATDQHPDTSVDETSGQGIDVAGPRHAINGGQILMQNHGFTSGVHTNPRAAGYGIRVRGNGHGFQVNKTQMIDGDGFAGTKAVVINGAMKGVRMDMRTLGFHGATDRLLICDAAASAGMRGCSFIFRGDDDGGTSIDLANPAKYVDIASGWHSSNEIVLINQTTGADLPLVPGTAY